jgi:hypothetical protein
MRKNAPHDTILLSLDLAICMGFTVIRITRTNPNVSKLALKNQLAGEQTHHLNPTWGDTKNYDIANIMPLWSQE